MLQTFRQTAALLFGITVLTLGMGILYILIAMAAASPYAPVMIAAEEWSDEVELMDNRSEMTR